MILFTVIEERLGPCRSGCFGVGLFGLIRQKRRPAWSAAC